MRKTLVAASFLTASFLISTSASGTLHMQTDMGGVDIELFDTAAPETVANFLNYVNDGAYDGTFIHRSVPGFVLQMGGYTYDPDQGDFFGSGTSHIPTDPPVINEFGMSNIRGTIAMAKFGSDPDSATSEFFINLADNSANLDNQNGGFTVFAQVVNGMNVVDSIVAEQRCSSYFAFNLNQCNGIISFDDTPLLNMFVNNPVFPTAFLNSVAPQNLVEIIYIGIDTDGDGAIDRIEDAGPNGGDANSDGILDSTQAYVASLPDINGVYISIETAPPFLLQSLLFTQDLGFLVHADPAINLTGLNFAHGFFAFEASNFAPGGNLDVNIILPNGETPKTYYKYGPTPDNPAQHLYEFIFDGETGAEFNGNVVTLHFADGERGDADLTANGVIVDPGAPALRAGIAGPGGGGGGCMISKEGYRPAQAGAWWLLLAIMCLHSIRRGYRRINCSSRDLA